MKALRDGAHAIMRVANRLNGSASRERLYAEDVAGARLVAYT